MAKKDPAPQDVLDAAEAKADALAKQLVELHAVPEPDDLEAAATHQAKLNILARRVREAGAERDAARDAIKAAEAEAVANANSQRLAYDRLLHNAKVFTGSQSAADMKRAAQAAIDAGVDKDMSKALADLMGALERVEALARPQ